MTISGLWYCFAFTLMIEVSGCAAQLPPPLDPAPVHEQAPLLPGFPAHAGCTEPIPDLFARVSPSVVSIATVEMDRFEGENGIRAAVGSGFIISDDGLVLTNSHVVFDRQAITVILDDGRRVEATLLGADPIYDLAVLRIPAAHREVSSLALGDSDRLRIGEDVIAIGNPLALEQTLTRGVVSGLNRFVPDSPFSLALPLIQTDAPINPGNSGGPLFNRCGEAVGITTLIVSDAQNIGFAIPINIAKAVLPQLIENGRLIRPWFGMSVKPIHRQELAILNLPLVDGLLIEKVDSGSPAQQAGVRGGSLPVTIAGEQFLFGGDIITEMNGQSPNDPDRFDEMVASLKVGDTVRLTLYRERQVRKATFKLPERPLLPGDLRPSASNAWVRMKTIRNFLPQPQRLTAPASP